MKIIINQAITAHQKGRLKEAEQLYRSILENQPTNLDVNNNLGVLLCALGKFDEAEASYRKAIEIKPDYVDAHYNLGVVLQELGEHQKAISSYKKTIQIQPNYAKAHNNLGNVLKELGEHQKAISSYEKAIQIQPNDADAHYNLGIVLQKLGEHQKAMNSFKKAIQMQPNYAKAHNNLGSALQNLDKFDEAEASYRKAIEIKPDYVEAHNNLGSALQSLGRLDKAEASYRKAIELKPDYVEANKNLFILLRQKRLLSKIEQAKKSKNITEISFIKKVRTKLFKSDLRLTSNTFISNRKVEKELISQLYKINTKKLNDVNPNINPCYGNGRNSDYYLFENDFSTIKIVEKDLINIMKETVKSDIFIMESFFNIFQKGSGIIPHNHVINFDNIKGLFDQKFSLAYYLDIGDQNCSEPGILKLQDPAKEILPSEGMITIFPSSKMHSAVYNGGKDRVMIGVNFYSLI
jgi:tetratricopeptide (TPR) repeat protein